MEEKGAAVPGHFRENPASTKALLFIALLYLFEIIAEVYKVQSSWDAYAGTSFMYFPRQLIPEIFVRVFTCFLLYRWVLKALKRHTFVLTSINHLILFSLLVFVLRISLGFWMFTIMHYMAFLQKNDPFLLGFSTPAGDLSVYMRPFEYALMGYVSTWLYFKLACWVFRRFTPTGSRIREAKGPIRYQDRVYYVFFSGAGAILVFYYASLQELSWQVFPEMNAYIGNIVGTHALFWGIWLFPGILVSLIFKPFPKRYHAGYMGVFTGLFCSLAVYTNARLFDELNIVHLPDYQLLASLMGLYWFYFVLCNLFLKLYLNPNSKH